MLRKYRDGDERRIDMTNESKEFFEKERDYFHQHLLTDESYTCIDSKGKVCGIMCFTLEREKIYQGWILFDRQRGYKVLRPFKKLVDLYKKNGNIGYTVSMISEKQNKMHRFFGCESKEKEGDKQVWVVL